MPGSTAKIRLLKDCDAGKAGAVVDVSASQMVRLITMGAAKAVVKPVKNKMMARSNRK